MPGPYPNYVSKDEKEARLELEQVDLELESSLIETWFRAYKNPSPTAFALDFGIDPALLKEEAASNDLVRLALYRMIAAAESKLYTAVYGPKAVIQRVELFLPTATVVESEFEGAFVDTNAG